MKIKGIVAGFKDLHILFDISPTYPAYHFRGKEPIFKSRKNYL